MAIGDHGGRARLPGADLSATVARLRDDVACATQPARLRSSRRLICSPPSSGTSCSRTGRATPATTAWSRRHHYRDIDAGRDRLPLQPHDARWRPGPGARPGTLAAQPRATSTRVLDPCDGPATPTSRRHAPRPPRAGAALRIGSVAPIAPDPSAQLRARPAPCATRRFDRGPPPRAAARPGRAFSTAILLCNAAADRHVPRRGRRRRERGIPRRLRPGCAAGRAKSSTRAARVSEGACEVRSTATRG